MAKVKLCILTEWYLPGNKAGGPIRSLYALSSILKHDVDIYILTTNKDLGSNTPYPEIKPNEWFNKDGINYFYLNYLNLKAEKIKEIIKELKPDIIYLNSFWSYLFSIYPIGLKKKGQLSCKVILAPRGMLGKGALNIKPYKKKAFIAFSKARKLYADITFHATNKQEENDIKKHYPACTIFTAENFNNAACVNVKRKKELFELDLFYLSRISRIKNLHLALNSLSKLPTGIKVTYTIYGNIEDSNYWKHCEEIMKTLPQNIKVNYAGEIPFHQVQNNIQKHQFLFLPTANENYGHSIVESLLCGCPAIISDQTPWNDLEKFGAGFSLPIKNDSELVKKLLYCANLNQEAYDEMSRAASEYINKKIDLPLIKEKYLKLFSCD